MIHIHTYMIIQQKYWNFLFYYFLLPSVSPNQNARPCKKPCSLRTTCSNCTSSGMECMWCSNTKRCVDSNAYIISFPYGQCLEWQTTTCSRKYLHWHEWKYLGYLMEIKMLKGIAQCRVFLLRFLLASNQKLKKKSQRKCS